jgi:hypothetical protein
MMVRSKHEQGRSSVLRRAAVGTALALCVGCGGRDARYDAPVIEPTAIGLDGALVIGDEARERVVVVTSTAQHELRTSELPVGKNRLLMQPGVEENRLFVLSAGVQPRLDPGDELPSLSVLDVRSGEAVVSARYDLPDPFSSLTLDPDGKWAVLSGSGDRFVTNPNQLVLIDLSDPNFEPITKTIRSFGAAPERFSFSQALAVPGGARRFLVVETRQDVALVDLDDLSRPEITIGLPLTPQGDAGRPSEVVIHAGDGTANDDARLAIRLQNDPNVVLVDFVEDEAAPLGFKPTLNLVDVGAAPAAVAFVATDARVGATDSGLRLAALVPARSEATLVNPSTTRVEHVTLPARFEQLRRVTEDALADDAGDVALLWSEAASMVAFWSLGRTSNQAFRSVDVLNLETPISHVFDVPGRSFGHKKLLQARDNRFFVLDLESRESFPMLSRSVVRLEVAPDGERAWAYTPNDNQLAQVDLDSLQPTSLRLERPILGLFDIATEDGEGRALIALHPGGGLGATVMDAVEPDTAATRFVPGILLGGGEL